MAIVDIVLIVILGIFAIIGLSKGFIKQIGKLIAVIIAIAAAVFLFRTVGDFIYKLGFVVKKEGELLNKFAEIELFKVNVKTGGKEALALALSEIKIPGLVQDLLFKLVDFENLPDTTIASFIAPIIVQYVCLAVAFLAVFIIAWIVVSIIVKAISKAVDVVPGAGVINRLLGMAFSVGKILLIIWALLYGLTFLTFLPSIYEKLNSLIATYTENSVVAKFILEHNGITWVIGKFFAK